MRSCGGFNIDGAKEEADNGEEDEDLASLKTVYIPYIHELN